MCIVFSCFKVLGVVKGKLTVELQSKIEPIPEEQKWLREKMEGSWFSLKNAKTKKYLTACNQNNLIMKGNVVFFSIQFQ